MRKANARERILQTASELFFQRGYTEVGVNEIIQKAQTAKASFYQYFPSKAALCEAWLKSIQEQSAEIRGRILEQDLSPFEKVDRYFSDLEQFIAGNDYRGCPYSNTCATPGEEADRIQAVIQLHKESTRQFFRRAVAGHFGDEERCRVVGDRIFLLYSGACTEAQNFRSNWPFQAAREALQELFSVNK